MTVLENINDTNDRTYERTWVPKSWIIDTNGDYVWKEIVPNATTTAAGSVYLTPNDITNTEVGYGETEATALTPGSIFEADLNDNIPPIIKPRLTVVNGYYDKGKFYSDETKEELLEAIMKQKYYGLNTKLYYICTADGISPEYEQIITSNNGDSSQVGDVNQPVYIKDGRVAPITGNVGSFYQPIYLNAGVITAGNNANAGWGYIYGVVQSGTISGETGTQNVLTADDYHYCDNGIVSARFEVLNLNDSEGTSLYIIHNSNNDYTKLYLYYHGSPITNSNNIIDVGDVVTFITKKENGKNIAYLISIDKSSQEIWIGPAKATSEAEPSSICPASTGIWIKEGQESE